MRHRVFAMVLAAAAPLVLGGKGGDPVPAPSDQDFPNTTIFSVDDVQVVNNPDYPLFVRISLDPAPPHVAGAYHTYFTIDGAQFASGIAQTWIAMLTSRLRLCDIGVEPKTGANAPDADGTVTRPYKLTGLSFGRLGPSACPRSAESSRLGLFYGQTPATKQP